MSPPAWARALDVLALAIAVLLVASAIFGGIRLSLGALPISITTWWRATAILAVVLAMRHALVPAPSALTGLRDAGRRVANLRLRATLSIWLATRATVFAIALLSVAAFGAAGINHTGARPAPLAFADVFARWDAGWYLGIAVSGYRWDAASAHRQQNVAFFPAFPMMMRVGGAILGSRPEPPLRRPFSEVRLRERTMLAGWLLALGAFLAALCAVDTWARRIGGAAAGRRSVLFLATFPFAVYYSAPYSEAVYLLATVCACNAFLRERAAPAAAWGILAALSRPNGFVVTVYLVVTCWQRRERRPAMWAAAVMPVVGVGIYSAYLWWLTGSPFAWASAHAAWGREPFNWSAFMLPIQRLASEGAFAYVSQYPFEAMNGGALLFALTLLPVVWRRLGPASAVFVAANLLLPLSSGGLMSLGRQISTMFPLFVALALATPRSTTLAWSTAFMALQALAAAIFFTGRPLV